MARRLVGVLSALYVAATLSACVSTEELYAEYDVLDCPVRLDVTQDRSSIIDVATKDSFRWEQAVYFEFDKAQMSKTAQDLIDRDIVVLLRFPTLHVSVQGFADRIGSDAYNRELSSQRVDAIADYLVANGVKANRIVKNPRGEGLPSIVANDTDARERNRRVELMLLDADRRAIPLLLDPGLLSLPSEPGLEAAKPKLQPEPKPSIQLPDTTSSGSSSLSSVPVTSPVQIPEQPVGPTVQ